MTPKLTFEQWLAAIDTYLGRTIGLSHDDLADWRYHDAYADGFTPERAAKAAIKYNNGC